MYLVTFVFKDFGFRARKRSSHCGCSSDGNDLLTTVRPASCARLRQVCGPELRLRRLLATAQELNEGRPAAGEPLTIGCTQEAPLFTEVAGDGADLRTINIRETAGWSTDAAKAGPKMAALIAASRDPDYPAEIVLVVSNRPDAVGLGLAREAGIPAVVIDHRPFRGDR